MYGAAEVSSYCLKFNHRFFVFQLETATTLHDYNWKCVPTTNAARKVRHTVVFMPKVLHRQFGHDGAFLLQTPFHMTPRRTDPNPWQMQRLKAW